MHGFTSRRNLPPAARPALYVLLTPCTPPPRPAVDATPPNITTVRQPLLVQALLSMRWAMATPAGFPPSRSRPLPCATPATCSILCHRWVVVAPAAALQQAPLQQAYLVCCIWGAAGAQLRFEEGCVWTTGSRVAMPSGRAAVRGCPWRGQLCMLETPHMACSGFSSWRGLDVPPVLDCSGDNAQCACHAAALQVAAGQFMRLLGLTHLTSA
jgi:hypothetical protein